MIPEFVLKHYAFTKGISYEHSILMHAKLEKFLSEVIENDIIAPSQEVDDVWHNFILHTKRYQEYCLRNFGRFIHHNPKLPESIDDLIIKRLPAFEIGNNTKGLCDNKCSGSGECDVKCSGSGECDVKCSGTPSSCDSYAADATTAL